MELKEACEKFRTFLYSSGVSDAIVVPLINLCQMRRKPENPIEYIRQNLPPPEDFTVASLTNKLNLLKKDIENFRKMLPEEKSPEPEVKPAEEEIVENEDLDE